MLYIALSLASSDQHSDPFWSAYKHILCGNQFCSSLCCCQEGGIICKLALTFISSALLVYHLNNLLYIPQSVSSKLLTLACHPSITKHEYRLKRNGAMEQPCRKPLLVLIGSNITSFSLIWVCISQQKDLMSLIVSSGTPSLLNANHSASQVAMHQCLELCIIYLLQNMTHFSRPADN